MASLELLHDANFAFPDHKGLKEKLVKLAKRNGLPLTQMMIIIIEDFLQRTKEDKSIEIKLK
jgi:hypothetical protein